MSFAHACNTRIYVYGNSKSFACRVLTSHPKYKDPLCSYFQNFPEMRYQVLEGKISNKYPKFSHSVVRISIVELFHRLSSVTDFSTNLRHTIRGYQSKVHIYFYFTRALRRLREKLVGYNISNE